MTVTGAIPTGEEAAGRDAVDRGRLCALFGRAAAGEIGALAGVWEECGDLLYGLALWRTGSREDAADAVQDVFVALARGAKRLGAVRNPVGYLLRATRNSAVQVLRRRRSHQSLEDAAPLLVAEADAERAAEAGRVSGLLADLPARQREVVYLKHFAELSFREIGVIAGVPTFTAASRYRLGMKRLRRLAGVEE